MLNLLTGLSRDCEGLSRRGFLQIGSLAGIGVSLPMLLSARSKARAAGTPAKDVNCILIWTQGGTSHHDTFDPKPNAPVSVKGNSSLSPVVSWRRLTNVIPARSDRSS